MNPSEITLVVGVDAVHIRELRAVWPTWTKFKAEILRMPMIVFFDDKEVDEKDLSFLDSHPNCRKIAWSFTCKVSQREKMLTGFVSIPCNYVMTKWYLKLDTDVIATSECQWIFPEWFVPDTNGKYQAFIASPWGYSKPRYAIDLLDDWADSVEYFAKFPRLNIKYRYEENCVKHDRIISWLFFGNTEWTKEIAKTVGTNGRPHSRSRMHNLCLWKFEI